MLFFYITVMAQNKKDHRKNKFHISTQADKMHSLPWRQSGTSTPQCWRNKAATFATPKLQANWCMHARVFASKWQKEVLHHPNSSEGKESHHKATHGNRTTQNSGSSTSEPLTYGNII